MSTPSRSLRRSLRSAAAGVVTFAAVAGCSQGQVTTLDAGGVQRAILTENDFPDRDGWTSTGISTESPAAVPVAPTALTGAEGMSRPCRQAFTAWTEADRRRKAGVNNNFTKFDADDLGNAVIVQLAVRSYDEPPAARERLRDVAQACSGTMTLTPAPRPAPTGDTAGSATAPRAPGAPANKVTIEPNPVTTPDADGLRITMPLDGRPAMLVTLVAQRGHNLAQVVALGPADRDIPALAQRVLDAQAEKLAQATG